MVWAILSPKNPLYRGKGNLSFLKVKRKKKKGGKIMGLVSGIAAKAHIAETAKSIAKRFGGSRKVAQKVNIISDDFTKTPGVLNLTTGTKTFNNLGGIGIRIVEPGAKTPLGQLGVTRVTRYPTGFMGNTEPLLAFETQATIAADKLTGKRPLAIPMTIEEAKNALALGRELQAVQHKSLFEKFIDYLAPSDTI